jgi:hypothetical protein
MEANILAAENEVAELEATLAEPGFYQNRERRFSISKPIENGA